MKNVIPATEARGKFFHLLNRVLYGGETIYITKTGADTVAKVESVPNSHRVLTDLAGSLSEKDAQLMKEAILKSRFYPKRKIKVFD